MAAGNREICQPRIKTRVLGGHQLILPYMNLKQLELKQVIVLQLLLDRFLQEVKGLQNLKNFIHHLSKLILSRVVRSWILSQRSLSERQFITVTTRH